MHNGKTNTTRITAPVRIDGKSAKRSRTHGPRSRTRRTARRTRGTCNRQTEKHGPYHPSSAGLSQRQLGQIAVGCFVYADFYGDLFDRFLYARADYQPHCRRRAVFLCGRIGTRSGCHHYKSCLPCLDTKYFCTRTLCRSFDLFVCSAWIDALYISGWCGDDLYAGKIDVVRIAEYRGKNPQRFVFQIAKFTGAVFRRQYHRRDHEPVYERY